MFMDFRNMSYGNKLYGNRYSNTAVITPTTTYVVPITDIEKNNYAPFRRLVIANNSGSDTLVYINGTVDGANTISYYEFIYPLPANYTLIIEPSDNIFIRTSPIIKNNSGSNIEIGKIEVMFRNY